MLNYDDAGVKKWAMSLANPWSGPARMPSPCPIQTCVYSDKIVNTIIVGSAQSFVFCFNPQILNAGVANQVYAYARSNTTANEAFYQTLAWVNHATGLAANYATQQATSGNVPNTYSEQIKVTSAGVRFRYLGTELNRSGLIRMGRVYHKNIYNSAPLTYNGVIEQMDSDVIPVGVDASFTWVPYDLSSFDFDSQGDDLTTSALIFYGTAIPVGTTIEYECVINYEYIPLPSYAELLGSNASPAPVSDNHATGKIIEIAKDNLMNAFRSDGMKSVGSSFASMAYNLLSGIATTGLKALPRF